MKISLIAAYDENNVIGNNGALPWTIPEELAWLKKLLKEVLLPWDVRLGRA